VEPETISKWVGVLTAVVWLAVALVTFYAQVRHLNGEIVLMNHTITLYPAGLEGLFQGDVSSVGTYILSLLYTVFKYVIFAVIIVSGIQASLGLVASFLGTYVPITFPRGGVTQLIRNIIGLLIIKAVVDASLNYFGAPAVSPELVALFETGLTSTVIGLATLALILGVLFYWLMRRRPLMEVVITE